MAPVGIANAGDPQGAYREAIDIAGAHQSSYGREAAGVFAAAVASAMVPGATATDAVEEAIRLAHDGTRAAIEVVCERAVAHSDWHTAIDDLRDAVAPFDTVGPRYREPALDARRASRTKAIEELPVALGMVVACDGDYTQSVLGAVNYGRDADSIAGMAGAVAGALGGLAAVPQQWRVDVATASRVDIETPGYTMAEVAAEILARDRTRQERRLQAMTELGVGTPGAAPGGLGGGVTVR
jgi:ADP-ribosylglycohydrolase